MNFYICPVIRHTTDQFTPGFKLLMLCGSLMPGAEKAEVEERAAIQISKEIERLNLFIQLKFASNALCI